MSWLFAKGPKTISKLTPFSSQFPNILYVAVKLKHVNSKTVLGPFAKNLLKYGCIDFFFWQSHIALFSRY
jgi:hypothetical protein